MDLYSGRPSFESGRYLLRLIEKEDCGQLLKVYGDKNALPFFNSDNCDGDIFYYPTAERMAGAIDFWLSAYKNRWFVRLSAVDKSAGEIIGTVEVCLRASEDCYNNMGILRVDVGSGYEREDVIFDIIILVAPHFADTFDCGGIITKAPPYAVERVKALERLGFERSAEPLVGKQGRAYGDYWVKK